MDAHLPLTDLIHEFDFSAARLCYSHAMENTGTKHGVVSVKASWAELPDLTSGRPMMTLGLLALNGDLTVHTQ